MPASKKGIPPVRLLLFTDEPVLISGLRSLFSSQQEIELSAVCSVATRLAATTARIKPDVLLLDMLPDLTFSLLVDMQRKMPEAKMVLWVRSISTELAYQAIEHGVRGIVRKTLPPETLLKCLRLVAEGGMWFEEALKNNFMSMRTVSLTRRESQLVSLLSQGLKNKEIATSLFISEGTVKVYLSRLFHKLGVKDRFELALYGLKNMPVGEGPFEIPQTRTAFLPQKKEAGAAQLLRSLVLEKTAAGLSGSGNPADS
jgi:DNA-binding NarL/FixJ family response regulator